jgi:3'-phosphoadenosine 5'-phosphosulfate sulfotransferase (PAPS reductase)/FAD synthetase
VLGLRTEESHGRSFLIKFGTFHFSKIEELYLCKPVLNWTGRHIWAYIISMNAPYLRWYDYMAAIQGYERARYANWAGGFTKQAGRFVALAKYYPEEFNRFAKEFPEIREYM